MTFNLYDDQLAFESAIRQAFKDGKRRVLGVAPTGFGKTAVFTHIGQSVAAKGRRAAIYAHRVELIDQIGAALARWGVYHGYQAPGYAPDPLAPVQVCSTMAAAKRVDRLMRNPFPLVIIDEAHHAAEGTSAHAIISAQPDAMVLGVTATPQRLGGQPLSIAFEHMVLGPSTADLIGMGRLSRFRLYAPSRPDMTGIKRNAGDFVRKDVEGVMDRPSITGDAVEHYKRLTPGKRALVFCASVAHAEHVAEQFNAAGYASASLDGSMKREDRRRLLADFASGVVRVLTSCDIVSEGFDVPAIEVAILLRPTESLALYLQQVGRALRVHPGKDMAIILDHAGNSMPKEMGGRGHGFPDDPREWSLEGGSVSKSTGERTTPMIICGDCRGAFRPGPACCPYCGHERDVKGRHVLEVEGILEEIDPDLMRQARREEQDRINLRVRQTRKLADLADLAVELGYKPMWLHRTHRTRKGGNPNFTFSDAVKAYAQAKARAKALHDAANRVGETISRAMGP
jgi:DNA repair protein RadD